MISFTPNAIDLSLLELALQEDLGVPYFDATTACLLGQDTGFKKAKIISKHPSDVIICGLPLLGLIAKKFGSEVTIQTHYQEGERVPSMSTIAVLEATPGTLLSLERTWLNFLRHLSGVATLTNRFTQKIKHTHCQILDTRKTTPGWRHLEKYAVQCGGGTNHRQGLYDAIMVKDTHVDLLGGMEIALSTIPSQKTLPVIVEVRNAAELEIALNYAKKIDRILLDNSRGTELKKLVQRCKQAQVPTEASGNLNLENIVEVAESGVDFASIGMLTHSAGQVDLSLKI
jgi:nicotinate-nucleotide pyrophosphorylase (carboxylating)